jgi:hypothetical protein
MASCETCWTRLIALRLRDTGAMKGSTNMMAFTPLGLSMSDCITPAHPIECAMITRSVPACAQRCMRSVC